MLINLASGVKFDNERMVSIKKEGDHRVIKLTNTILIELPENRYHWIMKISGHMVEINPELAVNVLNINAMMPTQDGYSVCFDVEPPAEITNEQAKKLLNQDENEGRVYFKFLDLEERILMLMENKVKCDDYFKL